MLIATFLWPQTGLAAQLVGIMFSVIIVSYMGMASGILYATFALMMIGMLVFIFTKKASPFRFTTQEWLVFALLAWMILSLLYTPTPIYGQNKILRFIGICLASLVLCRIFGSTREYMESTLRVLGWMSMFVVAFYILLFVFARGFFTLENQLSGGSHNLMLGYTAATGVVLTFHLIMSRDSRLWTRIVAGAVVSCGMVVIVASESRGPFLGLLGGAALTFLGRKAMSRSILTLFLLAVVTVVALWCFAPEAARNRILAGFRAGALTESGRTSIYLLGLKQYTQFPVRGQGVGAFAYYSSWEDTRDYPHNLVIEIAGEQGTIGLLLIGVVLLLCVKPILRLRSNKEPLVAAAKTLQWLFWLGLANSMSSFDMAEQRGLFASIGFLAAVRRWPEPEEEDIAFYPEPEAEELALSAG